MTNKELLRAIIAEIDFIMHDKDYRFPESENTWYSRESCKVLTPEEVFEELRTELIQLNNETNSKIAELQKQLEEKQKEIDEFKRIGEKGHLNDLLEDKRKENRLLIKGYEQPEQQLAELTRKYELGSLPIGGLVDEAMILEQQLADKEKEIQDLKEKLKSQPAEIVGKIRQAVDKEKSDNDLAWLGFNKLDRILNTILKWSLK